MSIYVGNTKVQSPTTASPYLNFKGLSGVSSTTNFRIVLGKNSSNTHICWGLIPVHLYIKSASGWFTWYEFRLDIPKETPLPFGASLYHAVINASGQYWTSDTTPGFVEIPAGYSGDTVIAKYSSTPMNYAQAILYIYKDANRDSYYRVEISKIDVSKNKYRVDSNSELIVG